MPFRAPPPSRRVAAPSARRIRGGRFADQVEIRSFAGYRSEEPSGPAQGEADGGEPQRRRGSLLAGRDAE